MVASDSSVRGRVSIWAGVCLLGVCIVLPMLWTVSYSLLYSVGGIGLLSEGWTLRYWVSAYEVGGLKQSFLFTVSVSAIVTLLATCGALGVAISAPHLRKNYFTMAMIGIPLATPASVMAVMVYQVLNPGGFLSRLACHAGLVESPSEFPVLTHDSWAIGLILAQVSSAWPLLTLFFLKTWTTARLDRFCMLAQSLGASSLEARWKIGLPMLLNRGRRLIMLTFLFTIGSYEIPLLLGRQSPQMFSVLTQRRLGQYDLSERPEAFVLAVTYLFVVGSGVWLTLAWSDSGDRV